MKISSSGFKLGVHVSHSGPLGQRDEDDAVCSPNSHIAPGSRGLNGLVWTSESVCKPNRERRLKRAALGF